MKKNIYYFNFSGLKTYKIRWSRVVTLIKFGNSVNMSPEPIFRNLLNKFNKYIKSKLNQIQGFKTYLFKYETIFTKVSINIHILRNNASFDQKICGFLWLLTNFMYLRTKFPRNWNKTKLQFLKTICNFLYSAHRWSKDA